MTCFLNAEIGLRRLVEDNGSLDFFLMIEKFAVSGAEKPVNRCKFVGDYRPFFGTRRRRITGPCHDRLGREEGRGGLLVPAVRGGYPSKRTTCLGPLTCNYSFEPKLAS
jgi:hypothetical protein